MPELLDIILVVVVLVSSVLAMIRGFSREILAILSWLGALAAALLGYNIVAKRLVNMIPEMQAYPQLPLWIGGGIIFVIVITILSWITSIVSDRIIDSRIGALDRTLGFIFGVARGVVLMSVTLIGFLWLANENIPDWVAEAKSKPMLEELAKHMNNAMPENIEKAVLKILKDKVP